MKTTTYTIRGTSPLLMHSERLANPFDPLTKELKAITGKRKKTETDLEDIARVEWLGGLYQDDETGIHLPGYNVFASIIGGGKIHKLGTAIKRSALVQEDRIPLLFEGPKNLDRLFSDKRFVDMRSVKVGTAKVMRCRPIFKEWSATFTVLFEETGLAQAELNLCLQSAGTMVGLGDYRPRFGRFEVVKVL